MSPDPLPDEAFVVRGGVMESRTLQINAEDHRLEHPDEWAISVASAAKLTVEEIARCSRWILNAQIRVSTVGAVRSLGHELHPSGQYPHADLHLAAEPSEELWEELRQVFDDPIPNPRTSP